MKERQSYVSPRNPVYPDMLNSNDKMSAQRPDENMNVEEDIPPTITIGDRISRNGTASNREPLTLDVVSLNITSPDQSIESSDYGDQTTLSRPFANSTPRSSSLIKPNLYKHRLYSFCRRCVWIYPFLISILVPVVCLTPYLMAVQYGQLNPIFPYVSDAGGLSPQAGFFSQLLDVIAILMFITSYIRYKMIKHFIKVKMASMPKISDRFISHMHQCNFIASLIVYVSALGVIIIGNFRVTEIASGHFLGVAFAFFGVFMYMCLMSYLSYQLSRYGIESRPYTMTVIGIAAGASLFFCAFVSGISVYQAGFYQFFENSFRLQWTKDKAGYLAHIIGTACEWVAINTVGPFYLCIFLRMKTFADWDKVEF